MNRGRQQLSLAVCDAPLPLHADRGPHAFFSLCVCSSSYCGLAYAAAASTCTWQRLEKYVVARAFVLLRESRLCFKMADAKANSTVAIKSNFKADKKRKFVDESHENLSKKPGKCNPNSADLLNHSSKENSKELQFVNDNSVTTLKIETPLHKDTLISKVSKRSRTNTDSNKAMNISEHRRTSNKDENHTTKDSQSSSDKASEYLKLNTPFLSVTVGGTCRAKRLSLFSVVGKPIVPLKPFSNKKSPILFAVLLVLACKVVDRFYPGFLYASYVIIRCHLRFFHGCILFNNIILFNICSNKH